MQTGDDADLAENAEQEACLQAHLGQERLRDPARSAVLGHHETTVLEEWAPMYERTDGATDIAKSIAA